MIFLTDNKLKLTRLFNASPAAVWAAWTLPAQLQQWAAPRRFTVTECAGDLVIGGKWRQGMRTPSGKDLWLGGDYRDITPPHKLVFSHAWENVEDTPSPATVIELIFADGGDGQTLMTMTQSGFAAEDSLLAHEEGWCTALERLAEHLAVT